MPRDELTGADVVIVGSRQGRPIVISRSTEEAAAAVQTKPWDMVNEALSGWQPDAVKGMWKEFTTLAGAAKELTRNGNANQLEAATRLLADARRKMYGLLAADEDIPNGDDLR